MPDGRLRYLKYGVGLQEKQAIPSVTLCGLFFQGSQLLGRLPCEYGLLKIINCFRLRFGYIRETAASGQRSVRISKNSSFSHSYSLESLALTWR